MRTVLRPFIKFAVNVFVGITACLLMVTPLQGVVLANGPAEGWLASGDPVVEFDPIPDGQIVPTGNTDCGIRDYTMVIREAGFISVPPFYQTELRNKAPCAVSTPRGIHNGVYLEAGIPAGKFAGHSGGIAMIPNSSTLMSLRAAITNIALEAAWYGAIVPEYNKITGEVQYNLTGRKVLADRSGREIYLSTGTIGYSNNGRWMVADSAVGFIRVDLESREIVPFAAGFVYGNGQNPGTVVAISDDGRYAVRANITPWGNTFRIYDLSTCGDTPDIITGPLNCAHKDVKPFLQQTLPDYIGSYTARFVTPELLTFISASKDSAGNVKQYSTRMSPSGQAIEGVDYLALGDSFSSGEGAYNYELGTDNTDPRNKCHLSKMGYPYLAAKSLALSNFHNVACSGAVSGDYYEPQDGQAGIDGSPLGFWLPGFRSQKRYLEESRPDVVTISMIGNDIGFSNKIRRCIGWPDSCFHFREDRESIAREIYSKFDDLVRLYESIQVDSNYAKVYVLGYPHLVSASGQCGLNISLDFEERELARGMVVYLNAVIKAAAEKAGVQYIDVENTFVGHQLCETGGKAVNGLTLGDDNVLDLGPIGNESFHPNRLGHQLLASALLSQSDNFTRPMRVFSDPGQTVDSTVVAPYVGSVPYESLLGSAPAGGVFTRATYTTLGGLEAIARGTSFSPLPSEQFLKPNSVFEVWLNSEPIQIGTLTTNENSELAGEVVVPSAVAPGYHTLHIYGQNFAGEEIDLYKTVYIAASEEDIDGDGVLNEDEECLGVEPANVDEDRDGIDDACDPEITESPADSAPPQVAGAPDREPNEHGWYNGDVNINWSAADPEPSSGAPTQPAATVASLEGINTYTSEQSCDPLNNCATGSLELKIDKTAPDITYTIDPSPTASGWNNGAVTVTFACFDATSGVADCTGPQTVSGADGTYVVTGSVTDNAGNSSGVNVFVSLDSTKPTVSQFVAPAANADGWNNTDVTVTPTCDDNLSGVLDCSPSVTLFAEGANQVVSSDATDKAGNTATATTSVNIDKTPPILGAAVWTNNPKSVLGEAAITVPATDGLSGIAEAEYYLGDTDPGQGNGATMQVNDDGTVSVGFNTDFPTGVYKVTVRAKDKAGNWSTPISDYLVVYDPFGTRMTGKRTLMPALVNGDILPGLIGADQADKAKFGFNVRYDKDGAIHHHSDFQFKYETGTKCRKPAEAQHCHSLELNATSIEWLTTQGQNDSTGIFQGAAKLELDGTTTNVIFRLTGLDGERLDSDSEDHLILKVYSDGANPNTATPIYQVNADVLRGNIKIRKW